MSSAVSSPRAARILLLLASGTLACSDNTGPDPSQVVRTYIGLLAVAGQAELGGVIQVSTMPDAPGTLAAAVARVTTLVVRPLWAQAPTPVSGVLMTSGGGAVPLSGTVTGTSVALNGGGYTIGGSANAAGGLVGTGTAPGGLSASMAAPPIPPTSTPAPANPTGTYTGTFQMQTTIKNRNTNPSGQVIAACEAPIRISGTLTLHLSRRSDGLLDSHLESRWTEVATSPGSCPPFYSYNQSEYSGIDFLGSTASLVAGKVLRIGALTKTEAFYGAVSGNTVVGVVHRSYHTTIPIPEGTHVEGWPDVATSVTLTRK